MALRVIMSLVTVGGLVGTGVHLLHNFGFEREIRPATPTGDVFMLLLRARTRGWPLGCCFLPGRWPSPPRIITPPSARMIPPPPNPSDITKSAKT
jgi:hypothetical protein